MAEVRHTVAIPYTEGYDTDKCQHYQTVAHTDLVKVVTDARLSGKRITVTEGFDQFGLPVLEFTVIDTDDVAAYREGLDNATL